MKNEEQGAESGAKEKCPRPYRLGQRETSMEATRSQVLAAARTLILGENAMAGFSVDAAAREAGVTRVTVYQRFGSKRGLLEALFDDMGAQGHLGERLPAVFACRDTAEALKTYIDIFCDFWEMDRVLARRLRAFAALDDEFAAAIGARDERRRHAIETLLNRFAVEISSPIPREELTRTLLALTSFEFYDVLAVQRTPQETAAIMYQLAMDLIGSSQSPTSRTPTTS